MKAIILLGMLSFGSVQLKTSGLLEGPGLVSLLIASGVFSLAVYFGVRTKKVGPTSLELHQAVQEVRDTESAVKELAAAVLEVIDSRPGTYIRPDSDIERHDKAIQRLRRLV